MGRMLKVVGIVLGAVVLLFAALLVAVGLLFDPNDYKEQIAAAVEDATGRTLTLQGDLELELFPRIRIAMGEASLSNAQGFGDEPFVQLEGARLQLKLLPLLARRVSVAEATLGGLRLNLERNAAGANNWQDIGGGAADAEAAPDAGEAPADAAAIDLDVDTIRITDAEVTWRDAATGSEWTLSGLDFEAADFTLGEAFPMSLDFDLAGEAMQVAVASTMQANLDLAANAYRLDDLAVTIDGSGEGWPGGEGQAMLRFDSFAANLDAETLDLQNLSLDMLGLNVTGTLEGRELMSDLALEGAIAIAEFDPHSVLDVFGVQIETADAAVFTRASASADFIYDSSQTGMRNMRFVLDDSTLTGSIGMEGEVLRFDLDVDSIDIDRYLPPSTEGEDAGEGSVDEVDLPIEPLRTFEARGTLSLAAAKFMNLTLTDAEFGLTAGDGELEIAPAANLYGGTIDGTIGVEVQGEAARFTLVQDLSGVDLNGLARDFLDLEGLTGTGNVRLDLAAVGSNVGAMRRDLDGEASFALRDGAWNGIDAWYELRRARAVLDRNDAPERDREPRTEFSNVSASGVVQDAVLTTQDFNATLPFMSVDGTGTVNLLNDEISFDLTAMLVDGPVLQSDPAMASMAGSRLPLTVGGTLAAPSIRPNFGALVSEAVQERVDEEREEVQQQVEQERSEVEERVDQEREDLRDRLRDRLEGLRN